MTLLVLNVTLIILQDINIHNHRANVKPLHDYNFVPYTYVDLLLVNEQNLNCLLVNSRSLPKTFHSLCNIVDSINSINYMAVTETWLDTYDTVSIFSIPGFNFQHKARDRRGRGVTL